MFMRMSLFSILACYMAGCTSTSVDGRSATRQDHVTFTKSVPGEGSFVMYAFLRSRQVHTLGYVPEGGKPAVSDRTTMLRDADAAEFERLFTADRMATYRADEWKGSGDAGDKIENCPPAQRVCSPAAPGQTATDCMCVPLPGSLSALQYEVGLDGVAGVRGALTFRQPMGEATTEMIESLESIRSFHFGK